MKKKILLLILVLVLIIAGIAACGDDSASEESGSGTEASETKDTAEAKEDTQKKPEKKPKKSAYEKLSKEEQNAYNAAKNYLDLMAFSKQGLIDQLSSEYGDNYPEKVAKKAVKVLEKEEKIDWTEQAKKSARNYLDTMSFSKQGLIEQLESEYGDKYTHEQAVAAVEAVYE